MYNNMIFLAVNAFLNWTFVFGGPFKSLGFAGFGFIGAAISLTISRTMQGVVYYIYMFVYKQHHKDAWPEIGWSFANHTKDRTVEFMKQSLPNIGTLLFQAFASQATTVLVGRLGELPIAASSALSAVTIPFSGTMSATCMTVSGVRVGYHLGRGDPDAAKQSSWIVLRFITVMCVLFSMLFMIPYMRHVVLNIATDDEDVLGMATTLVPAMLVGTYMNLIVGNITSGVFSGQGRPVIATILSFGFEMPLSIGGVAIYILLIHGNLLGVYWYNAASGAIEAILLLYLMAVSNWSKCANDARARQEAARAEAARGDGGNGDETTNSLLDIAEDGATSAATTDLDSSSQM
jgi:MATE family multidrug resistance protein